MYANPTFFEEGVLTITLSTEVTILAKSAQSIAHRVSRPISVTFCQTTTKFGHNIGLVQLSALDKFVWDL